MKKLISYVFIVLSLMVFIVGCSKHQEQKHFGISAGSYKYEFLFGGELEDNVYLKDNYTLISKSVYFCPESPINWSTEDEYTPFWFNGTSLFNGEIVYASEREKNSILIFKCKVMTDIDTTIQIGIKYDNESKFTSSLSVNYYTNSDYKNYLQIEDGYKFNIETNSSKVFVIAIYSSNINNGVVFGKDGVNVHLEMKII